MTKILRPSAAVRALLLAAGLASAWLPSRAQATMQAPMQTPVAVPGTFAENPIVYFVMTDRFVNGDPTNDHAYGRQREMNPKDDVGTWHGGDFRGLTQKLKEGWFKDLGVNALWITAPYEQIHGWVQGGQREFKHYAYHGYWALDYTVIDQNLGTAADLRDLVDTAHAQGIRVLFDVVMNHPGYLDIQTAKDLKVDVLWEGWEKDANLLRNYHNYIDYNSFKFGDWWGRPWVRAGLPGYIDGGRNDLTMQLAFLPDFRTESPEAVKLPKFLKEKADTKAVDLPNTTVRGYLIQWLTDWVREYGVDGFRCDTVKHVEPEAWAALKTEAVKALAEFKAKNPTRKVDDAPFWMVGEFWGAGPEKHKMTGFGFDAMINFDFQQQDGAFAKPEKLFRSYAQAQAGKPVHMLNYLSSHDTELFDRGRLIEGGTALLLAPGGVQIFYGDETARPEGPMPRTDKQQATRSDMNWGKVDAKVLAHWRKLGTFRARHRALATGEHKQLGDAPYTFSRIEAASGDRVVVALGAQGQVSLPVAGVFADGETLRDAYTGRTATVAGGKVALQAEGTALLERVQTH
ncbi:alpha-amylase family glycosyl hydrolase [Geothrix terrae]|uniref:alpha-amylase family glycosyl hydrolase n=1 Tax=Geothrix terrae TaxID=2922720 RepID=UPI001FAD5FF3|nr:alpha-amylase family glycosyl hydrolase [Geothrix terrae]